MSLATASERQRMVHPRKSYPVDPGFGPVYERTGRPNVGHALETAVFLELERRGYECSYVRTRDGLEVDFLATRPGSPALLIQVCASVHEASTRTREVRALASAVDEHPEALPLLLTLDASPASLDLAGGLRWMPAVAWFLSDEPGNAP